MSEPPKPRLQRTPQAALPSPLLRTTFGVLVFAMSALIIWHPLPRVR